MKPTITNQDVVKKMELDKLHKLQSAYLSQIPKLVFTTPTDGSEPSHNYFQWLKRLLKYYTSLSPVLAEVTETFLQNIDIDDFIDRGKCDYPIMDDDDYPDLSKMAAMSAITTSVSEEFEYLLNDATMTDIFPSLVNIHCTCRPNSIEERTDQLISFWDMKMGDESDSRTALGKFSFSLRSAFVQYNSTTPDDPIPPSQLLAALKNGIIKSVQADRFAEALKVMKYRNNKMNFQSTVIWLQNNVDKTKPLRLNPQQASAARTRGGGGGRGGRGAGRGGGKGGKGKGNDGKGSRTNRPDGNVTSGWNQDYYKVAEDGGNETTTKEIQDIRSKRPCFTKFEDGKCANPDCPYNHDFNLLDRSKSESVRATEDKSSAALSASRAEIQQSQQSPQATSAGSSTHEELYTGDDGDDGFDYAYDLGFRHSVSSAFAESIWSTRDYLVSFLLLVCSIALFAPGLFDFAHASLSSAITVLMGVVRPGRLAFALCNIDSYSFLLVALAVCLLSFSRTGAKVMKHAVSSAYWLRGYKAVYQVILDCGCTFTMSGDKSLFVPSSLSPINESVGLAESGHAVKATHFGKICIGGKLIDALYVPDFRQTMVSMGQLEKMGLRYSALDNTRNFLTPNGSVFLSFTLATNNLYFLVPPSHTNSASSASV
jgi:hypothetical protein